MARAIPSMSSEDTNGGLRKRILVVEDDLAMRELLVEALEEEGYGVLATGGGRGALAKIRSTRVDLVVSDLRMPDLGGINLAGFED